MKINIHMESSSRQEDQKMIYNWAKELAYEYKIGPLNITSALLSFISEEELRPLLIKYVKDKHGLTISYFRIGSDGTTLAHGFDIQEDEYFTKFMLER